MELGKFYDLEVAKEVDFGVSLTSDLGEILLPLKYLPENIAVGDTVHVFLHRDSEDRLLATTLQPKGVLGDIVSLEATHVTPHGAFMSWGLEKDLFVPNREQHIRFIEGNRYIVRICIDYKSDRLIGVGKLNTFLSNDPLEGLAEGSEVDLLVYNKTDKGFVAVINQKHNGLIYHNEIFEPLNIGDEKKGFIKKIREDGKIDLSLSSTGLRAMDENGKIIIQELEANEGYLPFHDKSSPEEIIAQFSMSKKAFKKAVGTLYKAKLIHLEPEGIRMI